MRLARLLPWAALALFLAAAAWVAPAWPQAPQQPNPAAPVTSAWTTDAETSCIKCHGEVRDRTILFTPHGVKGDQHSPMALANHSCESCHGPSSAHNDARPPKGEKRPPTDVVFKGEFLSPVDKRNQICAGCHQGGEHINWTGSAHQRADVACTDCHASHVKSDPVMAKKTEPQVCFTCHGQERTESLQTSHHPIREGKVTCSDCHNTHGSGGPKLLKEFTLNETCYLCHPEQRGPFVWEHQPVREDCSTCHRSHGSPQTSLLTQRQPFVCMTCHQTSRANHDAMVSGGLQLPGSSGVGTYNMLLGRGCSNCHSKVHGSNAPSGGMLTH